MLDLTDPMAEHIFQAAGLMNNVKLRGQKMSVSPSTIRAKLFAECVPLFAEMRELAYSQFSNNATFILATIDKYETAIRTLSELNDGQITHDQRDGEGNCLVCGTPITKFQPLPNTKGFETNWIIYCRRCVEQFMEADVMLDSSNGFGTFWI